MTGEVAGADGCRSGWVVVRREGTTGRLEVRVVGTLTDVLEWSPAPRVLGIDLPIGLLDRAVRGGRDCDREARRLLGAIRGRSVFSPPVRAALEAESFEEALAKNRESSVEGKPIGISRQSFGIFPKIREVDRWMTPKLQRQVVEVHPELSFYEMNGEAPIIPSKKSEAGRALRLKLLEKAWGVSLGTLVEENASSKVARDDILDAMAVCWTAERVLDDVAIRVPEWPPIDSRGLRMEIVR